MKISKQKYHPYGNTEQIEVIEVIHDTGMTYTSEKISDHLLFAILEKLEDIRCGLIHVEEAVNKLNPALNLTRKIGG